MLSRLHGVPVEVLLPKDNEAGLHVEPGLEGRVAASRCYGVGAVTVTVFVTALLWTPLLSSTMSVMTYVRAAV